MHLIPLPAFDDNYLWLLHDHVHAMVIDPGDAAVVTHALNRLNLQLAAILITHHHADHTGGVQALRKSTGAHVYGPSFESMPEPLTRLSGGSTCTALGLDFQVLDVPGHTSGHIAYYCPAVQLQTTNRQTASLSPAFLTSRATPVLFCGDTLFSGGCGRLFEGTPAQMLASLDKLSALPDDTLVCCAHEYTVSNLKFATAVDPANTRLAAHLQHCQELRIQHIPTLPSNIALERQINPFLRSSESAIRQSLQVHSQTHSEITDDVQAFALLREWKNSF